MSLIPLQRKERIRAGLLALKQNKMYQLFCNNMPA